MKISELNEGYWKRQATDAAETQRLEGPKKPAEKKYKVVISGKVWTQGGVERTFSRSEAQWIADRIRYKYDKPTQIVPVSD